MKPWLLPSSRQRGLAFILPNDWTPEQALAVVELLDDLRDRIWTHYQVELHEVLCEQRAAFPTTDPANADSTDPPF